ncbi:MAG: site-2 protease family protein [Mariniblastus sp.]|nr:site-2 protease family protein [Mariniblastus sp.]
MFQVLLGLGAVIFVHELGHFLLAKACGVKCDKFYVGFDVPIKLFGQTIIPAKLVYFQWGETEYGIGSIPLGGYVKMMGQDDNPGNIEEQVKESIADGETADAAYLESGLVDRSKLDPRSFLAKSVPQRMAIISAGVIFNLIFAVFFAAWAFKSGVDYEPPVIGNVIGGGPAWENNMTGAEIEKLGDKEVKDYFTYMDMAQEIVFNGDEQPLEVTYKPFGETGSVTVEVTPRKGFIREADDLALIGVSRRLTPIIGAGGAIKGNAASKADPPFESGDLIVEVNGTKIENDIDLRQTLARDADRVAHFVIERTVGKGEDAKTERIETSVETNPMHRLGFSVGWLPVSAIQKGSPAEAAGLKVGDELMSINDASRGDLMTLDKRMIKMVRDGVPVKLGIKRADGEVEQIDITPIIPKLLADLGPNQPLAIDTLGIAIPMNLLVESIESGSSAQKAGLAVGDELVSIKYVLSDEQKKDDAYVSLKKDPNVNFVDDTTTWGEVSNVLDMLEPGTEIELVVKRNSETKTLTLTSVASAEFFQHKRGISLKVLQKHYKSDNWSDAVKYGVYQVKNDTTRVGKTLAKLIRGKISPKNLGGPGTIAMAATSEASRSTSRLLLFLTFLSANLAIVNFLPIPILDGGHMLFLAYEGIFRRPVSERVQLVLTYTGLIMILGLMAFVIFLDVGRISSLL